ncbi:MAG: folate-binding protein, partial [Hyphomicrobiales bacterium]|nr:folate-binding protein [Hyphomicrobiales bacterium]
MPVAHLPDRAVISIEGEDVVSFLTGLVTCAVDTSPKPHYGALLTPQGKIIADFIVAEAEPADGGGFFLDCPRALAPGLVEKLNFYRLRAKVIVEDLSGILGVLAVWGSAAAATATDFGLAYADP